MPLLSDMIQNLQEIKKLWTLGFKKENSISLLLQLCVGKAAKCGKMGSLNNTHTVQMFTDKLQQNRPFVKFTE